MDNFKIDNYRRLNPNMPFPKYKQLDQQAIEVLQRMMAVRLGLSPDATYESISTHAYDLAQTAQGRDFAEPFRIRDLVPEWGQLSEQDDILIDWSRKAPKMTDVDKFSIRVFEEFFDDIIYLDSDQAFLCDPKLKYLILIDSGWVARIF